jgi:hypothetical protein
VPWYKLPRTDARMWFDHERPDLEQVEDPAPGVKAADKKNEPKAAKPE